MQSLIRTCLQPFWTGLEYALEWESGFATIPVLRWQNGDYESCEAGCVSRAYLLKRLDTSERLLSSRIIEFGAHQTRWICQQSGENDVDGWRVIGSCESSGGVQLNLQTLRGSPLQADVYSSKGDGYKEAIAEWDKIVRNYTSRALKHSLDRPLAISGIAEVFANHNSDQYLAGLWGSRLHFELLWKIERGRALPPPRIYQGPLLVLDISQRPCFL